MSLTFRPLNIETDLPRYAELLNTVHPEPVTVEQLLEWEQNRPKDGIRQQNAALDESNEIVGFNLCTHTPYMLPGSFLVEVIVAREYRRRGVGSRIFANVVDFARSHGATRLECEVREHNSEWRRFAEARGFQIDRHIFESTLDLAAFDEKRFGGVVESVVTNGFRFFTFADVDDTEETRRKLYELNKCNSLDIPGSEGTFPRFEDFQKFVFGASWFRPRGQIFAAGGERWVGMSAVGYFEKTNSVYTMHTGVLREYRGRKIALALKLLTIRFALELGATYMRTNNDSKNQPILAINQALGYKPMPGYFRMLKTLGE